MYVVNVFDNTGLGGPMGTEKQEFLCSHYFDSFKNIGPFLRRNYDSFNIRGPKDSDIRLGEEYDCLSEGFEICEMVMED